MMKKNGKILKKNIMSVKSKTITMRKSSGFQISIDASVVDTPKGKIRTIVVKDHEVLMADKPLEPPYDQITIICNDMDLDTNKEQLKELCEFLLGELKDE